MTFKFIYWWGLHFLALSGVFFWYLTIKITLQKRRERAEALDRAVGRYGTNDPRT